MIEFLILILTCILRRLDPLPPHIPGPIVYGTGD